MYDTHGAPNASHNTVVTVGEERRRLVNVQDAAKMLGGVSVRHVYRMLDRGELKSVPIDRRRMVLLVSIDEFVQSRLDAETAKDAA